MKPMDVVEQQRLAALAGPLLLGTEIASRLQRTVEQVTSLRESGQLLGIRIDDEWRYPAIQLAATGVLPGLAPLLRALGSLDGWDALYVLTGTDLPAEDQPIELLRGGNPRAAYLVLIQHRGRWAKAAFPETPELARMREALDLDIEAELRDP
jgi:hypothetical protein